MKEVKEVILIILFGLSIYGMVFVAMFGAALAQPCLMKGGCAIGIKAALVYLAALLLILGEWHVLFRRKPHRFWVWLVVIPVAFVLSASR